MTDPTNQPAAASAHLSAVSPAAEPRPRGLLEKTFSRLFLKQARVVANDTLAPGFHRIALEGDSLRGVAWIPGQLIQIGMAPFVARSYTPIAWDTTAGRTHLVAYAHGHSLGSDWARAAGAGTGCEFFGPRASMDLRLFSGAVLLFGDETSFGIADAARRTGLDLHCVFEVNDVAVARQALTAMGIVRAEVLERRAGDAHLADVEHLLPGFAARNASFLLTGKAGSIQRVRQALKPLAVSSAQLRVKAYWAPGKKGMD